MKTKSIFLSALLLLGSAFSAFSATPKKYKINFSLKGVHDTKAYMGYYYGDKSYVLDSANVDGKGNFHFEDTALKGGVYFVLLKNKRYFEFIIDKEQNFTMRSDTSDFVKYMKVEGSPENELFYSYLNYAASKYGIMNKLQDSAKTQAQKTAISGKMDSLNNLVKKYKEDFIAKHPGLYLSEILKAAEAPEVPPTPTLPNGRKDSTFAFRYYKSHFFDNFDFSDDRLAHAPPQVFYQRIDEYFSRLTFQIPDSIDAAADYIISKAPQGSDMFKFLVVYVTNKYANSEIMGMDAVFVHMVKKYYTPQIATWVSASQLEKLREEAEVLEPILIGKKAPSMVLPDTSNIMTALDSINARYTIICFWDYDCFHCQKEIPKLIKWYDSIKGEGIQVYAVLSHQNLDVVKWKDFIKKYNLDWLNVADLFHTSNYGHDYDVTSTPLIYVLDDNKRIIAKKIDVSELDGVLKHDMESDPKTH